MYLATRTVTRFYEYTNGDDPTTPGDAFNIDGAPHTEYTEHLRFDSVADLVAVMRRDGVTFDAYSDGMHAGDVDGSCIINYETAERESITWDVSGLSPRLLDRVIIPAIDAR